MNQDMLNLIITSMVVSATARAKSVGNVAFVDLSKVLLGISITLARRGGMDVSDYVDYARKVWVVEEIADVE